jgi:hypothetical protein
MKVYILTASTYDSSEILGVFLSKVAADKQLASLKGAQVRTRPGHISWGEDDLMYSVEEHEVLDS